MVRRGHLRTTLIMLFNWAVVCVSFYTLTLNSTRLYGDIFVNYMLATVVSDLPITLVLLVTLKYFTRRFNLFYCQLIVAVSALVMAFLPKESPTTITVIYLIGKCFSSACFTLVYLITAGKCPR